MAQRRSQGLAELKVGFLVLISFVLLAMAIVFIGGDAGVFRKKMTVTAYFPSANGLRDGAEVWLEGVMIGNVSAVRIAREPGPNHNVDIEMRLDSRYDNIIRNDSMIGIGTIGLLGDKNIEISRGTENGTPIGDNGILQGEEAGDIRRIITGTDDLVANLKVLSDKIVKISESVDKGEGTLGKLLTNSEIHDNLNSTVLEANRLVREIRTGSGTAGKLISDDEVYQDVRGLMARMDTIMDKVDRGDGTIGKFMNDPTLYNKSTQLIDKFGGLADRIERGEGTLGKLSKDEALYTDFRAAVADMRAAVTNVNTLIASVQNGDGTAGKLIKDPTLYNSANQTISEIQKLMYDLRQDPKKYLTINFRLF